MNRLYFSITLIGILSFAAFAQNSKEQIADRPAFAGAWEIKNKESNPLKNQMLVINQSGDELSLIESFEYKGKLVSNQTTLYADKRGEQNLLLVPGADSAIEVKSKTSWKKGKLVRVSTFNEGTTRETQTYSLSEDGNSLTVETTGLSENPLDDRPKIYSGKRVYQRKK
jgi:hypothetical protein